jgi:hypothetical protein
VFRRLLDEKGFQCVAAEHYFKGSGAFVDLFAAGRLVFGNPEQVRKWLDRTSEQVQAGKRGFEFNMGLPRVFPSMTRAV